MTSGRFWIGLLLGIACTVAIASNIGSRATAQEAAHGGMSEQFETKGALLTNPDPKIATDPFVVRDVVIDDRGAQVCLANGATWTEAPANNQIELDLGTMHWSLSYLMKQQRVRVMKVSTRVMMSVNDAESIDNSLRSAITAYHQHHPTTQPMP